MLRRYAVDTWASMRAMVDERTGLVADQVDSALTSRSTYTSPTNVAGYLWSIVAVRELGVIDEQEAHSRLSTTVAAVARLERHGPSGMFYNWYSPQTGAKLTAWPNSTEAIQPFLSTVDNGWLAAALRIVSAAEPALSSEALAIASSMDFAWFHDPSAAGGAGLNRVGFWPERPDGACSVPADGSGVARDVFSTCASYGTTVSEARIATYVGIAAGQLPASTYFAPSRTGAATGTGNTWMRQPHGELRRYDGVPVLETTYGYSGMRIVPSWDGSMFEALMPDLLVPEAEWGPRSWGINHRATVAAQKHHGLDETAGLWGFSPAADPAGGYGQFGVSGLSIKARGSGNGNGNGNGNGTDDGAGAAAEGTGHTTPPLSRPSPDRALGHDRMESVVAPYASFLALPYDAEGALDNLARLENDFGAYGGGGFYDAIDVETHSVAPVYLSLDQSMVLAAIGNTLADDVLKRYFVDDDVEDRVRPLVAAQVFGSTID